MQATLDGRLTTSKTDMRRRRDYIVAIERSIAAATVINNGDFLFSFIK
jgi:hypothetical protein